MNSFLNPDPTDPMSAVWSSIRVLLMTIGTVLVGAGVSQTSPVYFWVTTSAGAVTVLGPAAWAVWAAIERVRATRALQTKSVAAGAALVVSGNALTVDGKLVPGGTGDGALKPFTTESAAQTVRDFTPVAQPKAP